MFSTGVMFTVRGRARAARRADASPVSASAFTVALRPSERLSRSRFAFPVSASAFTVALRGRMRSMRARAAFATSASATISAFLPVVRRSSWRTAFATSASTFTVAVAVSRSSWALIFASSSRSMVGMMRTMPRVFFSMRSRATFRFSLNWLVSGNTLILIFPSAMPRPPYLV